MYTLLVQEVKCSQEKVGKFDRLVIRYDTIR